MCKDSSMQVQPSCDVAFRLEEMNSAWRLVIPAAKGQPEAELSETAVRLQFAGASAEDRKLLHVPLKAQPLDMDNVKCSFSRKRSELVIEWPQTTPSSSSATAQSVTEKQTGSLEAAEDACEAQSEAPREADAACDTAATNTAAEVPPVAPESVEPEPAAEKAQDEAQTSTPESEVADKKTADEWKALGNDAVKAGNHEEGVRCYSAGIAASGGDEAILRSNRALCLLQLDRNEDALEDCRCCISLRPDFFKGYLRGAKALRALGRAEEALAFLKKCPKHPEAETMAAELRPEAEAAEAKRIASLTGCEKSKEEGNVLFRKGSFEAALEKYSQALEECDDQESSLALAIRNNRAACYHQISDFHSVVRDTNFVLERQPGDVKALCRRMLALEPLEKYEAALKDARAVLRQDPHNDMANKVQHRLSKLVRELQRDGSA